MTPRLLLQPGAEADIEAAAAWYAERSAALAQRFRDAVRRELAGIEAAPRRFAVQRDGIRRVLVPDFPYALFYIATDEVTAVIACMHVRQNPERWQSRR